MEFLLYYKYKSALLVVVYPHLMSRLGKKGSFRFPLFLSLRQNRQIQLPMTLEYLTTRPQKHLHECCQAVVLFVCHEGTMLKYQKRWREMQHYKVIFALSTVLYVCFVELFFIISSEEWVRCLLLVFQCGLIL